MEIGHSAAWDYKIRSTAEGVVVEFKGERPPIALLQSFLEEQRRYGLTDNHWARNSVMQLARARTRYTDWRDIDEE